MLGIRAEQIAALLVKRERRLVAWGPPFFSTLLACALPLVLAGCPDRPSPGAAPVPTPTAPAPSSSDAAIARVDAPVPSGILSSSASSPLGHPSATDAGAPGAPGAADHAAVSAAMRRACDPPKETTNNFDMKEQSSRATECLRRRMVSDLDAFLLPLKGASSPRFPAWMKSQADWNRFTKSLASLKEELQWVDLTEGSRLDGSGRGVTFMACERDALIDRAFLARALAGGNLVAFVARAEALQSRGRKTREAVVSVQRHAKAPPKPAAVAEGHQRLTPSEWQDLAALAKAVDDGGPALARATCELWPEAAAALGGSPACEDKLAPYYLAHCDLGE